MELEEARLELEEDHAAAAGLARTLELVRLEAAERERAKEAARVAQVAAENEERARQAAMEAKEQEAAASARAEEQRRAESLDAMLAKSTAAGEKRRAEFLELADRVVASFGPQLTPARPGLEPVTANGEIPDVVQDSLPPAPPVEAHGEGDDDAPKGEEGRGWGRLVGLAVVGVAAALVARPQPPPALIVRTAIGSLTTRRVFAIPPGARCDTQGGVADASGQLVGLLGQVLGQDGSAVEPAAFVVVPWDEVR